jgi:formylglycine-generating enzyme required for sulfatase activity
MRHWFLSYTSQDFALTQALKSALQRKDPDAQIFFASESMRAGGFWKKQLAEEIEGSTVFILLVGERGLGDWQVMEYYEALDRRAKEPNYPIILILSAARPAPGLPFARQLHWVLTEDPASEATVGKLIDAASGPTERPTELWRFTRPYRGLEAMTEANSDYFFGRGRETVDVINALASHKGKLPILLGNSGVGKSSLAQAGVMTALLRQGWPEQIHDASPWPVVFDRSRHWCFLTLRPGAEPVRALAEPFIRAWQFDSTDPRREERLNEWTDRLRSGSASLRGLLDATQDRLHELGQVSPPSFFLYVDQGEELYVRSKKQQRRCFSEIVAAGLADPRLRALMSLRADFFGELQNDASLFAVHRQINVAPLRETELHQVVSTPANLLSARFQTGTLATDIARRTAEESTEDAGTLPLLSYLLDDMWNEMVERGDGVLRLPKQAIDLAAVLVERANRFVAEHPDAEDSVRRMFTLKLATVREDSEPTRRRALRSEFSEDEWKLVSALADHPNRLLVTATPEGSETYTEVAHEAIFRRWKTLHDWIAAEREFLAWRTGLEAARRAWENAPDRSRSDALLMGFALTQALGKSATRRNDIPRTDLGFIELSQKTALRRKLRVQAVVGGLTLAVAMVLTGWHYQQTVARFYGRPKEAFYRLTDARGQVLTAEAERARKPGDPPFKECTRCPEMVVVPAGEFIMGSPDDEKGHETDEGPQHKVILNYRFAIGKFQLTFEEWDACVDYGSCDPHISTSGWGRGRQPVINMTWDDAKKYVRWLSRITRKTYRLLTEAEWEYAARAGSQTAYPWGDEIGKGNANCFGCGSQWDNKHSAPVGQFKANGFGLHDMPGNVAEWVEDCYHENYNQAPSDGSAWTDTGHCNVRAVRGGSWYEDLRFIRSANRYGYSADTRNSDLGFRVGRTLLPP